MCSNNKSVIYNRHIPVKIAINSSDLSFVVCQSLTQNSYNTLGCTFSVLSDCCLYLNLSALLYQPYHIWQSRHTAGTIGYELTFGGSQEKYFLCCCVHIMKNPPPQKKNQINSAPFDISKSSQDLTMLLGLGLPSNLAQICMAPLLRWPCLALLLHLWFVSLASVSYTNMNFYI